MPRIPPGGSSPPSTPTDPAATTTTTTTAAPTSAPASAPSGAADAATYAATGGTVAANVPVPQGSPLLGGLPDVLLERAGARVVHGDDPGDYYCEHMFWSAQRAASSCASIASNAEGEPLVGFLHVPDDKWTSRLIGGHDYSLQERHEGSWHVVGAALRGFFDDAAPAVAGPVRMLLTGFGPFMTARNNPTGELVTEKENLDELMRAGFGRQLTTAEGEQRPSEPDDPPDTMRVAYTVTTPAGEREVVLRAQRFAVDDTAIDPAGDASVQAAMLAFEPHAVLSMGVWGGKTFKAEHHADDGGLNDAGRHAWTARADRDLPDNFALARAIERGGRAAVSVPASTLLTGGDPHV
jgi:hypothetical protein